MTDGGTVFSQRLRLLLDIYEIEHGSEPTFPEISGYLSERHGLHLSRSRWSYVLNGHRDVHDPDLVSGLAAFFGVEPGYLLGEAGAPEPEKVSAQLNLVRAMRARQVRAVAARAFGELSPGVLDAITQFLEDDLRSRGSAGGLEDPSG